MNEMTRTKDDGTMTPAEVVAADFVRRHESFQPSASASSSWLTEIRRQAIEQFASRGLPTTREEAWRYTSLGELAREPFAPLSRDEALRAIASIDPTTIDDRLFGTWYAERIVFVNGHFSRELSRTNGASGPHLGSLALSWKGNRELIEPHLSRHADIGERSFTALNTAFLDDGALIWLPESYVSEKPIHLVFLSTEPDRITHPRALIVASRGSQTTIVESYLSTEGTSAPVRYATNAVTEIVLEEGAVIDHYKLQRESERAYHLAALHAHLARDATFSTNSIDLGSALARNDVTVTLDGEGADATLNGLYVLDGSRHVDNHTIVDHAKPHGTSRQLYKGVLDGRSRGVFDGMVIVRQDAQKTDSRQENRNLILSEDALVDTKPTLKIHADDVKCSHAATTGQIDERSMFYLRSRAIDPETARRIMIHAFVSDILKRVRIEPIRSGLDALLFDDAVQFSSVAKGS